MVPKYVALLLVTLFIGCCYADDEVVDNYFGASQDASKTDENVVQREEEAIKLDGLSVAQMKELRDKSEKHTFQAEVNRMMKLIINSLYKNKEIFLRELISNASDALDKIRLLSLTDPSVLSATSDLNIKIKADKDNHLLHITDTGVGMTKADLINNLGTIARSGTSEFLEQLQKAQSSEFGDLIGQFGVGFYSSFLVADTVVVTTKHNDDKQYIWESDSGAFTIVEDPRGDTLLRGTQITLHLKEEAYDFLEEDTLKVLVHKYSQFINFPIYLWASKTETVEEPLEEEEVKEAEDKKDDSTTDEEAQVEEEKEEEKKPKTKSVTKTTWDWELINNTKPIWTRDMSEIGDDEYEEFYKSITKDNNAPLAKTHFTAEGEVTFKALLFVPQAQPSESFQKYGAKIDNIKMYVRRVFITDNFEDMMPNYLNFIKGVVDSDDLPLNVSRETLQQHKLLKVIKKKLIRKTIDMLRKMKEEDFLKFWKEFSTNIKLGVIEDNSNKTKLAKLLRFLSSSPDVGLTSLSAYVERMKDKQEHIYYIAGSSKEEVEKSPFVESLLKRKFEVLYLTEAVDEYCISALPEFEGKKFQNVAKEGLSLETNKEKLEEMKKTFEPLTKWLADDALKDQISKAVLSERLSNSPCALVAGAFGWTGNMERLAVSNAHKKTDDPMTSYYMNQKKTLEVNPRHPLIKELLNRIEDNPSDPVAKETALMMFRTATLRSGYMLKDTVQFAESVEKMMRKTLGISEDEAVEEETFEDDDSKVPDEDEVEGEESPEHEEL